MIIIIIFNFSFHYFVNCPFALLIYCILIQSFFWFLSFFSSSPQIISFLISFTVITVIIECYSIYFIYLFYIYLFYIFILFILLYYMYTQFISIYYYFYIYNCILSFSRRISRTLIKYIYKFLLSNFSFFYLPYQTESRTNYTNCICTICTQSKSYVCIATSKLGLKFQHGCSRSHVAITWCRICQSVDENRVEGTTLEGTSV